MSDLVENHERYYIDGLERIWTYDPQMRQWASPDLPFVTCSWTGLNVIGGGSLREATPAEREEIDREVFS